MTPPQWRALGWMVAAVLVGACGGSPTPGTSTASTTAATTPSGEEPAHSKAPAVSADLTRTTLGVERVPLPPHESSQRLTLAQGSGDVVMAMYRTDPVTMSSMWLIDTRVDAEWRRIDPPFANAAEMFVSTSGATVFVVQDRCLDQRVAEDENSIVCERFTPSPSIAYRRVTDKTWTLVSLSADIEDVREDNLFAVLPVGDEGVLVQAVEKNDVLRSSMFFVSLATGASTEVVGQAPSVFSSCDVSGTGRFLLVDPGLMARQTGQEISTGDPVLLLIDSFGRTSTVLDSTEIDLQSALGDELFVFCDERTAWLAGENDDNTVRLATRIDGDRITSPAVEFPARTIVMLTSPIVALSQPTYDPERGLVGGPSFIFSEDSLEFVEGPSIESTSSPRHQSYQASALAYVSQDESHIEIARVEHRQGE